jgi:hypothetical protein
MRRCPSWLDVGLSSERGRARTEEKGISLIQLTASLRGRARSIYRVRRVRGPNAEYRRGRCGEAERQGDKGEGPGSMWRRELVSEATVPVYLTV